MSDTPKAKDLIRESLTEADDMGAPPPRGPRGPGGPPQGRFNPRERDLLKNILIADLLTQLGRDPYAMSLAEAINSPAGPDDGQIQHFMDEGANFYDMLGDQEKALMDKLASGK